MSERTISWLICIDCWHNQGEHFVESIFYVIYFNKENSWGRKIFWDRKYFGTEKFVATEKFLGTDMKTYEHTHERTKYMQA